MGFFSKVFKGIKKVAKVALPIVGAAVGGPVGGALGGAAGGALGGGGLKGALTGAAMGGVGGYLSGAGGVAGAAQKLGLGTTGFAPSSQILWNAPGQAINWAPVGQSIGGLSGTGLAGAITKAGRALSSAGSSTGLGSILGGGGGGGSMNTLANVYSGIQGSADAKKMAASQRAAANRALALQAQEYNQTKANLNPFITTGQSANTRLSDLLGLSGGDAATISAALQQDPGYQFRVQQGQQAIDRSLGARGQLFSGAALKAAQQYGQDLANQTYNDAVQRIMQASQSGQQAAGTLGAFGADYAGRAGGLEVSKGDIAANARMRRSNVANQSLANILGANVGDSIYKKENNPFLQYLA
jgi:hypothetical protein